MRWYRYSARTVLRGARFDFPIGFRRNDGGSLDMDGSRWKVLVFDSPDTEGTPLLTIDSQDNPTKVELEDSGRRCHFLFSIDDTKVFPKGMAYLQVFAEIPAGGDFDPVFHLTIEAA